MNLSELYIVKSRTGHYKDNAENRRLHRVGQQYGGKEAEPEKAPAKPKFENREDVIKQAARAFDKLMVDVDDNWADDDFYDEEKNEKLDAQLYAVIKHFGLSEPEFRQAYDSWRDGYPLAYADIAAKGEIRDQLDRFEEEFDNDAYNNTDDESKIFKFNKKLEDDICHQIGRIIDKYEVTKTEWEDIVEPYIDGLGGLSYDEIKEDYRKFKEAEALVKRYNHTK